MGPRREAEWWKERGGRSGTNVFLYMRQWWTALPYLYDGLHLINLFEIV